MVVFEQVWLYSGESGCIFSKLVLFGQKWLYSGKSNCLRAKVVVIGQNGCIRTKWLYSGKVVVSGKKQL